MNHAIHMAAVTQIRHRHSDGRLLRPQAGRRPLRQRGDSRAQTADQRRRPTPVSAEDAQRAATGPEGRRGTTLSPARPAHTPNTGSSTKLLPDPPPPYDRPMTELSPRGRRHPHPVTDELLDKQRGLVRCSPAPRDSPASRACGTPARGSAGVRTTTPAPVVRCSSTPSGVAGWRRGDSTAPVCSCSSSGNARWSPKPCRRLHRRLASVREAQLGRQHARWGRNAFGRRELARRPRWRPSCRATAVTPPSLRPRSRCQSCTSAPPVPETRRDSSSVAP